MKLEDYQRACERSMQMNRQINQLFDSARSTKPMVPDGSQPLEHHDVTRQR